MEDWHWNIKQSLSFSQSPWCSTTWEMDSLPWVGRVLILMLSTVTPRNIRYTMTYSSWPISGVFSWRKDAFWVLVCHNSERNLAVIHHDSTVSLNESVSSYPRILQSRKVTDTCTVLQKIVCTFVFISRISKSATQKSLNRNNKNVQCFYAYLMNKMKILQQKQEKWAPIVAFDLLRLPFKPLSNHHGSPERSLSTHQSSVFRSQHFNAIVYTLSNVNISRSLFLSYSSAKREFLQLHLQASV